jgi:hypothetical protein
MLTPHGLRLPFKSVAGALLLSLFLGPIGLLYATTLGGVVMLIIGVVIVPTKLPVPIAILWIGCCIWSVIAADRFNQKVLQKIASLN